MAPALCALLTFQIGFCAFTLDWHGTKIFLLLLLSSWDTVKCHHTSWLIYLFKKESTLASLALGGWFHHGVNAETATERTVGFAK
jgi:hypothetical protein